MAANKRTMKGDVVTWRRCSPRAAGDRPRCPIRGRGPRVAARRTSSSRSRFSTGVSGMYTQTCPNRARTVLAPSGTRGTTPNAPRPASHCSTSPWNSSTGRERRCRGIGEQRRRREEAAEDPAVSMHIGERARIIVTGDSETSPMARVPRASGAPRNDATNDHIRPGRARDDEPEIGDKRSGSSGQYVDDRDAADTILTGSD